MAHSFPAPIHCSASSSFMISQGLVHDLFIFDHERITKCWRWWRYPPLMYDAWYRKQHLSNRRLRLFNLGLSGVLQRVLESYVRIIKLDGVFLRFGEGVSAPGICRCLQAQTELYNILLARSFVLGFLGKSC